MKSINAIKIIISRSRFNGVTNAERGIINSANQRRLTLLICHFLSPLHPYKALYFFATFSFFLLISLLCFPHLWAPCSMLIPHLTRPPQGAKAQQSLPNKILAAPLEAPSRTWMWTSMWKWGITGMEAKSHLWDFRGTLNRALRAKHGPCQIWSQHKQSKFSVRTLKSSRAPVSSDSLCVYIYLYTYISEHLYFYLYIDIFVYIDIIHTHT